MTHQDSHAHHVSTPAAVADGQRLNIVAPDRPIDHMHERLQEHGYLIVEELATDLAQQTLTQLTPHIEQAPFGHDEFLGARTKRLGGVLKKSSAARELATHPTVLGLLDRVLLPFATNYQINFTGIMHLEPGAEAQSLHRDGDLYPLSHHGITTLMPTMWALSDFSASNGGTQVVPGSHRWPLDQKPSATQIVAADMPKGSVLIYLGGTSHGGGGNRSAVTRTGLAFQYSLGWLRQEENQYLAHPPEVAAEFSEKLRRLLGYDYGGSYLGFHNGDDPHRIFEPDYAGPAMRSTPEIDAAKRKLPRFGLTELPAKGDPF
ncbi:MAG: phytanoyl-CoA dioxygenase family protein [Pseudomonadota bacterium]